MAYDGSLIFDTRVDNSGFQRGANTIRTQTGGLSSAFKKLGGAIAVAFAVKKVFDFGKQAVSLASDLQEVQNVVDTAFGDMSYKMEEFANKSIEAFGISKLAAKKTGSTFMAMASGMGIAKDGASDMAVSLTGLSADMSSFYNVTQDVASTALKSIFTGETETLKQFGIVMTEANLQAFALSQGINKQVSAMTQAEKVQLRYAFVMNQTKMAQGDFAKTSDSWANQTRILSEKWKEFLTILGNGLLKILAPVVKALNVVMTQLINFATKASNILSGIFGNGKNDKSESQKNITSEIQNSVSATEDLTTAQEELGKAVKGNTSNFDELNTLDNGSEASIGAGGLGSNVSPIIDANVNEQEAQKTASNIETKFRIMADSVADYFKKTFGPAMSLWGENIKNIFSNIFGSIKLAGSSIWNDFLYPQLQNFINIGVPIFVDYVTQCLETWDTFYQEYTDIFNMLWQQGAQPALKQLSKIWDDLWIIMQETWDKWGAPIFEGIRSVIKGTADIFKAVWENFLKPIFDALMERIDWIWEKHLKQLVKNFMDFVGELISGALEIYSKVVAPIVKWLVEILGPVFAKAFNIIGDVVGSIIAGIIDVISGLITVLKGIVQFITGVFTGNWSKAWEGIKKIFKGIWDMIVGVVKVPINLIIDLINGLVGGVVAGFNNIIKAVNKLSFTVPDWVPAIGGKQFGFNLKEVTAPRIAKLATGTVVPANYGEFMAILGDNKRETEVVSPLPTMKQAFKEALSESNGNNNGRPIVIVLKAGTKQLAQVCIDGINELTRSTGELAIDLV